MLSLGVDPEERKGVSGKTQQDELGFTVGMVNPKHYRSVEVSEGKSYLIGNDIKGDRLEEYKALLLEFVDVFAWSYADLKGVSPEICEHRIELLDGKYPVRQRQYRLNPRYSMLVKNEIDKL